MRGWTARVTVGLALSCFGLVGGASAPVPEMMAAAPEIPAPVLADQEQPFTGRPVDDSGAVATGPVDPAAGVTGELPTGSAPPPAEVEAVAPLPAVAAPLLSGPRLVAGGPAIPEAVLAAYRSAAAQWAVVDPGCRLSWAVLAAIGRIESSHASGGRVDTTGRTIGRILGVPLDGSPGVAAIRDTDGGMLDGDPVWDRAVGPMQFIPTTWAAYRTDGNRDGVADPHNVHDAAISAARYLCARGGDLSTAAGLVAAIFRYNGSAAYVSNVVSWALAYGSGVTATISLPGPVPVIPGPPVDQQVRSALPPRVATPAPTTVAPRAAISPTPAAPTPTPVPTRLPTTSPVTTSPVTTSPVTTSPVTTPPVTTPPVTVAPVPTEAPATPTPPATPVPAPVPTPAPVTSTTQVTPPTPTSTPDASASATPASATAPPRASPATSSRSAASS